MLLKDKDEHFMEEAAREALKSSCLRLKGGCVIVKDNQIVGRGFNSPPKELESQRRCFNDKNNYDKKVTDKTCCVHAEQRAMIDALFNNPLEINGSRLYFIKLDGEGKIAFAGMPYCTICSKMALDLGVREFVLWREEGICVYDLEEYNDLSFSYS